MIRPRGQGFRPLRQPPPLLPTTSPPPPSPPLLPQLSPPPPSTSPPLLPQPSPPPPRYFPIIFSQENVEVRQKYRLKFLFRKVQRKVNNVIISHCVSLIWTPRLGQSFLVPFFQFQIFQIFNQTSEKVDTRNSSLISPAILETSTAVHKLHTSNLSIHTNINSIYVD